MGISTSSPTVTAKGFAFAASPRVMYPPNPESAFIPYAPALVDAEILIGIVNSAVVIVSKKNRTCSVAE